MRPLNWITGLAVAFSLTLPAFAQETLDMCGLEIAAEPAFAEQPFLIETPDGTIQGTLAEPVGQEAEALVLMLHGFRGARNENGGMFRRAAHMMADLGIASLRIDFIGSGQSDGDWADTRFSHQARDAVRAVAALSDAFGGRPVSVLGYSQGGLVSLRTAAAEDPFDRIAIWAPALDPIATYAIIFGEDTIWLGAELHGVGETDLVPDTRLRPGYFAELAAADPIAEAAQSEAPMLVVMGRRDPLVRDGVALAQALADARAGETQILDVNAGHDFGALREPPLLAHVVGCTARFLLEG